MPVSGQPQIVQPVQTQQAPQPVKSKKGLYTFLAVIGVVCGILFASVRLGYLKPNVERCNTELLYHFVQNRDMSAKTFKLPFSEEARPWLWEPGAPINGGSELMWLGACKGVPAPANENIRVSFDGLGLLLFSWITSTIAFGFSKKRMIGLLALLLLAVPLLPHGATSFLAERLTVWTAWARYVSFWILGLVYFIVSWKLLNKSAARPGTVVSVQPVVVAPVKK